ncbi:hypothetical protein [Chitinophaga filiformis]|uniref:WD40-like Beta Propeller Repeat n=1 Tax=Chitinophaga filiformis TaxID=104663 RepID=A0ABY4HU60_CHIFI|nr:hypothetical protein [Chitinophaga filiformis]UPK67327.1 hypothetical protein MYF79_20515 [Chitinophaga filiformis]
MNYIEEIRAGLKEIFNQRITEIESEIFISPSENFRLEATMLYDQKYVITRAQIYQQSTNEKIFDFLINEDRILYSWVEKKNIEYMICAEDLFGGQTIIDLTNRKMVSYSPKTDGYIWTNFHLSPNGNLLATIGCIWGGPYYMKIFDFTNPMVLPLPEIKEIDLLDNDEEIIKWIDNETLQMKGFQREYEREYNDKGWMTVKPVRETPMERIVRIS